MERVEVLYGRRTAVLIFHFGACMWTTGPRDGREINALLRAAQSAGDDV